MLSYFELPLSPTIVNALEYLKRCAVDAGDEKFFISQVAAGKYYCPVLALV